MPPMRCEVLLFAQLADIVKSDRLTIDLHDGATVADVINRISQDHPAIGPVQETLAAAVNQQYCRKDYLLADGDTIALIPPVSGG